VRILHEILSPGVQYGQQADLGAQVAGIGGHLLQRFAGCLKKHPVEQAYQHPRLAKTGIQLHAAMVIPSTLNSGAAAAQLGSFTCVSETVL